jgi:hypothetical protein
VKVNSEYGRFVRGWYAYCLDRGRTFSSAFPGFCTSSKRFTMSAVCSGSNWSLVDLDRVWNVMAHARNPCFVFRLHGRVHLNRRGRQFSRLLAVEMCVPAVVMLDTPCSEVVWRVLDTHSIRRFPFHFLSRASPCAITLNWTLPNNHRSRYLGLIFIPFAHTKRWNSWTDFHEIAYWLTHYSFRLKSENSVHFCIQTCMHLDRYGAPQRWRFVVAGTGVFP